MAGTIDEPSKTMARSLWICPLRPVLRQRREKETGGQQDRKTDGRREGWGRGELRDGEVPRRRISPFTLLSYQGIPFALAARTEGRGGGSQLWKSVTNPKASHSRKLPQVERAAKMENLRTVFASSASLSERRHRRGDTGKGAQGEGGRAKEPATRDALRGAKLSVSLRSAQG